MRTILALSALFLSLGWTATSVQAKIYCQRQMNGSQLCRVGIASHRANIMAAHQRSSQWCWAASIQMVFRHFGYQLSQPRLVQQAWGRVVNMPANPRQILRALNRVWIDDTGRRFRAIGDVRSANLINAAHDLSKGYPLIIGTRTSGVGAPGHAMVLTAMTYLKSYGGSRILRGTVRDPWPRPRLGFRTKRFLTPGEWRNLFFIVRIRVQPLAGRGIYRPAYAQPHYRRVRCWRRCQAWSQQRCIPYIQARSTQCTQLRCQRICGQCSFYAHPYQRMNCLQQCRGCMHQMQPYCLQQARRVCAVQLQQCRQRCG